MTTLSTPSEEEAFAFAMQFAAGSAVLPALRTAIELDLLELIKKAGPVSPKELAAKIRATNPEAAVMLDRILRLLAAHKIVDCSLPHGGGVERLYSLSPLSDKFFTKNKEGVSLAPLLLLNQDYIFIDAWYHLKDAIVEGGVAFNRAYGINSFEYQATDSRFDKAFNQAMHDQSTIFIGRVVETYDGFKGVKTLVDVGGGIGASLKLITSKYPSIKAINFDLPHVIQQAPSIPGVEHIAGDMFINVPTADAILIKWICHNWSDEHCLKLLKICEKALPRNGKLIVADRILSEIPKKDSKACTDFGFDLIMMAYHPGGKERKGQKRNFELWLKLLDLYNFGLLLPVSAFPSWNSTNKLIN